MSGWAERVRGVGVRWLREAVGPAFGAVAALVAAASAALAVTLFGASAPAMAQDAGDAPRQIRIGTYIINLEQLTVNNGNYTAEFFLTFECDGPCNLNDFRVVNGTYSILDTDVVTNTGTVRETYHIRANLNENLSYSDFPFDQHTLNIRIESADETTRSLEFVADDRLAGLAPDLQLASWVVLPEYAAGAAPQTYKIYDEPFSRYTFSIMIERPALFGWLKALLPATVIMISGLLAYLFSYDSAGNSIAVVTAALAGSVLFNINLTSSLPATGHLTTADLFMIVNYIALVITLTAMISVFVLKDRKRDDEAKRLFSLARRYVPLGWVLAQATLLLFKLVIQPAAL